jgi:hypothetical protein
VLDPEFRHLNRRAIPEAIEAGRSLLRDPLAPLTPAIPNPARIAVRRAAPARALIASPGVLFA